MTQVSCWKRYRNRDDCELSFMRRLLGRYVARGTYATLSLWLSYCWWHDEHYSDDRYRICLAHICSYYSFISYTWCFFSFTVESFCMLCDSRNIGWDVKGKKACLLYVPRYRIQSSLYAWRKIRRKISGALLMTKERYIYLNGNHIDGKIVFLNDLFANGYSLIVDAVFLNALRIFR